MEILLKLPEKFATRVNLMMEISGIKLPQDLINEALTLFEWALIRVTQGEQIAAVNEEKNKWTPVNMESLSHAGKMFKDSKIF